MKRLILFLSLLAVCIPALAAYSGYTPVPIASNLVPSTLTNKTIFVHLSGNQFKAATGHIVHNVIFNGQTVPADFVFSASSTGASPYKFELAYWDQTGGNLYCYVKIPSIGTAAMTIYAVYGDAAVTTYQGGAVGDAWDSSYVAVWHLYNGSLVDSTANGNSGGTNHGTVPDVTSATGGGASFTAASGQYISIPSSTSLDINGAGIAVITVVYYATSMPTSLDNTYGLVSKTYDGASSGFGLEWRSVNNQGVTNYRNGGTGLTSSNTQNSWQFLQSGINGTFDHFTVAWLNGAWVSYSGPVVIASNANPLMIGSDQATTNFWNGKIAEVRIQNAYPAGCSWGNPCTVDYNNIMLYGTYVSQGSEVWSGASASTVTITPIIL